MSDYPTPVEHDLPLFEVTESRQPAATKPEVETRAESWKEKSEVLGDQKKQILAEFEKAGRDGLTRAELADIVAQGRPNRICQAVVDLISAGWIRSSQDKRATEGGRLSVVLKIVQRLEF